MTAPIVLIVGAGDYIGAAIARRFAQGGFVVCLARRNGEKPLFLGRNTKTYSAFFKLAYFSYLVSKLSNY